MGRLLFIIGVFAALPACSSDETLTAYGAQDTNWRLIQIDGTPYGARAVLRFSPGGAVAGLAPCNRFNAVQTAPYPWFALENVAIIRTACPDLAHEHSLMTALDEMTQSETAPGTLLLSNKAGREMLFHATE